MRVAEVTTAAAICCCIVSALGCVSAFVLPSQQPKRSATQEVLASSVISSPPRLQTVTERIRSSPSSLLHAKPSNNDNGSSSPISRAITAATSNPAKSLSFSLLITLCGAALGPFLDSYHSAFGVLQYDEPLTAQLWGSSPDHPALITAWWVPELFGLAGFIIGWLYVLLDEALPSPTDKREPSPPLILIGIAFFTFQYWLSGILYSQGVDRGTILNVMSVMAAIGFAAFDLTEAGLWTSLATAVGGPAIEVGLITFLVGHGGYHYSDAGETGFFPLWILPVYFLGGPAVGNLSRGIWTALSQGEEVSGQEITASTPVDEGDGPRCTVCNDSRAVGCPNCDAQGYYITYGRKVTCPACKGRGLLICRDCFPLYGEDPSDIEAIREKMSKMPD